MPSAMKRISLRISRARSVGGRRWAVPRPEDGSLRGEFANQAIGLGGHVIGRLHTSRSNPQR